MAMTYASYVTTLANLLAIPETNSDFLQVLPTAIDYAENRIYNQFSFLSTKVSNSSGTLTPNSRIFTLPVPVTGSFQVIERLNVISSGTRYGLTPVSRDVMDTLWPTNTSTAATDIPTQFAMETDQKIIVGPAPGSAFQMEVIGYVTPTPLSASNTTTYLTENYPELLVTASMIFLSGWQKNFGGQSDSPQQAQSWESQYQILSQGISEVDARQNFEAASWTSAAPAPLAQPQRG